MRHVLAILPMLALAACASPQERCVRSATKDLRTLNGLIAESEATLARGYGYRTELRSVNYGLTACTYGVGGGVIGFCADNQIVNERVPVAVDLDAERRTLATLRSKQAELERAAAPAIAQCGVQVIGGA